jgi:hypothetical protein
VPRPTRDHLDLVALAREAESDARVFLRLRREMQKANPLGDPTVAEALDPKIVATIIRQEKSHD